VHILAVIFVSLSLRPDVHLRLTHLQSRMCLCARIYTWH